MAKITEEDRQAFNKESGKYRDKIAAALEQEKNMLSVMKSGSAGVEYQKLILAEDMVTVASYYIAINSCSLKIMDIKNNDALNDARKMLYKSIIYLEEVVTNVTNCAYADLTDRQELIVNTPIEKRYNLVKKLGLTIQMVIDGFGDNSKWKWSFVELQGRFATVAKNLIDMKTAVRDYFDPNASSYDTTVMYIRVIKKLLEDSANAYRDKYELSSRRFDDMTAAINYLLALRRIAISMGSSDEAEEIKKKAVVWKDKMEADRKSGKSN
ncbi:MAG: hypothetical protein MJ169_03205 [Treponema sp.]|nr:hypothetical protein [Treponema sp.]